MKRRSVFVAMAALAALALSAPATHAEAVFFDSGTLGPFSMTNEGPAVPGTPGAENIRVSFLTTSVELLTLVNGVPVSGGSIPASFTSPFTLTVTPTGADTYNVSVPPGTALTKTFGSGTASAELGFSFTAGSTSPIPILFNSFDIGGPVTSVLSNGLSPYDFSTFAKGGTNHFVFTADNISTGSFASFLRTQGATAIGNGAFSQSAIPEPTSMALLGIGLSGLFAFRRFLKRAFVA